MKTKTVNINERKNVGRDKARKMVEHFGTSPICQKKRGGGKRPEANPIDKI